jgi:folate-dependent phosphoribosylglycinamide formyltransferase PurN
MAVDSVLTEAAVEMVCLAGFMRILTGQCQQVEVLISRIFAIKKLFIS